jgi:hypothetical protein
MAVDKGIQGGDNGRVADPQGAPGKGKGLMG